MKCFIILVSVQGKVWVITDDNGEYPERFPSRKAAAALARDHILCRAGTVKIVEMPL